MLGVGDASGMFPIDSTTGGYDAAMLAKFNALADKQGCPVDLVKLLPTVLPAGEDAGMLTVEGRSGSTQPARCSPACRSAHPRATPAPAWPPRTVWPAHRQCQRRHEYFAMVVLEKPLSKVYPEIDMVTTPTVRRWPWSTATTAPAT